MTRCGARASVLSLILSAGCAAGGSGPGLQGTGTQAASGAGGGGGEPSSSGGNGGEGPLGFGGSVSSSGSGNTPLGGTVCDAGIDLEDTDPMNAARAMELCDVAPPGGGEPGVIAARWVRADGSATPPTLQFGIQPSLGASVLPQAGERMLMLSTGFARGPGQPGECVGFCCGETGPGTPPPGFPTNIDGCTSDLPADALDDIEDDIALEVDLRAPADATGYRFAFKFFSFEYPEFVCSQYNDQFVALVEPPPPNSQLGNISFDDSGTPIGVNLSFFEDCDPGAIARFASKCHAEVNDCPAPPAPYCPQGLSPLLGTGFDGAWDIDAFWQGDGDAGATAWLQSSAPIEGGAEVRVRFAIWDKGDSNYDASVLVDHFEWLGGDVDVDTDPVPK